MTATDAAEPRPSAGQPAGQAEDQGPVAGGEEKDQSPEGEGTRAGDEERDQPQNAWSARRDLADHVPRTMRAGIGTRFGGSMVGGDQHGVSGGQVAGDVIMGSQTTIYQFGPSHTSASGEVPQATLDRLAATFTTDGTAFDVLLERLRRERILVLSGAAFSGRRTAALMLLRGLGASPVRTLLRDTAPDALSPALGAEGQTQTQGQGQGQRQGQGQTQGRAEGRRAKGYVLCDLTTRRDRPLREPHLLAVRDRLVTDDAYLVITLGPDAVLEDIDVARWEPPRAEHVLDAHLRTLTAGAPSDAPPSTSPTGSPSGTTALSGTAPSDAPPSTSPADQTHLLALPAVSEFLAHGHQLREVVAFAGVLSRHSTGDASHDEVADFSQAALEGQVREWFEEDEETVPLRDKAFLVALAAFDGGPYALTAELSDVLFNHLQKTQQASFTAHVPVFGTHIGKRLALARATRYPEEENTEWGPVTQWKSAFRDERASLVLLREVWTGHPSARPALVKWLSQLSEDRRPLVRTRAASTAAVLAYTDLPSTMALIIEDWAHSKRYRQRLVAANALALTHLLGSPNIARILDDWGGHDEASLRWVALRTYALIGPEHPERTLVALRRAVRKEYEKEHEEDTVDELMVRELADSVELLLLSPAGGDVLQELLRTLNDDRAVHDLALAGFLHSCRRTQDDETYGQPLILAWYATSAHTGEAAAPGIAALWRTALGDRVYTTLALETLRAWALIADRNTATEWALAALLPRLVASPADQQRISHLLRTMAGEDGAPPPPVAARLLTVLRTPGGAAARPVPHAR